MNYSKIKADFSNIDPDIIIDTTPLNEHVLELVTEPLIEQFIKLISVNSRKYIAKITRNNVKWNDIGTALKHNFSYQVWEWVLTECKSESKARTIKRKIEKEIHIQGLEAIKQLVFVRPYFTFQNFIDKIGYGRYSAHDRFLVYNHASQVVGYKYYKEIDFGVMFIISPYGDIRSYKFVQRNFFQIENEQAIKILKEDLTYITMEDEEGMKKIMIHDVVDRL